MQQFFLNVKSVLAGVGTYLNLRDNELNSESILRVITSMITFLYLETTLTY